MCLIASGWQVQQIRVAHDSEERALNAKAVVEEERDSLLRQVAATRCSLLPPKL